MFHPGVSRETLPGLSQFMLKLIENDALGATMFRECLDGCNLGAYLLVSCDQRVVH